MRSKIKVGVPELIKAIEKKRADALARYQVAKERHASDTAALRPKIAAELRKHADAIEAGTKTPDTSYGEARVKTSVKWPSPPQKPHTGDLDNVLATLRLATDETVLISTEDAGRYL